MDVSMVAIFCWMPRKANKEVLSSQPSAASQIGAAVHAATETKHAINGNVMEFIM